jgi:hypothetical protein
MNPTFVATHRGLLHVLFALFETLYVVSIVVLWSVDPRRMSSVSDAAGITFFFSFAGLLAMWWLLRRVAPRLAGIGLLSALLGFLATMLLPAV